MSRARRVFSIQDCLPRTITRHYGSPLGLSLCSFNNAQVHGIDHCGVCQQLLHSSVFLVEPEQTAGHLSVMGLCAQARFHVGVTCNVVCCIPVVGTLLACVLSHTALMRRGFKEAMQSTAMLPV